MIERLETLVSNFFYQPVSGQGFSLMRIGWALLEIITYLLHWPKANLYYAANGVYGPLEDCADLPCSINSILFSDTLIHITFGAMLLSLVCVLIGYKPRLFLCISLLLLICFDARNPLILNGGDRIEKAIAFLLIIAPNMHWYSINPTKKLMNSVWVVRLLLWQLIIVYSTAGLHKLEVTGWLNGNKIGLSLHLEQFLRFPMEWYSFLQPLYLPLSYFTVFIQIAWLFLLLPASLRAKFIWHHWPWTLKQTILLGTACMHLGIMTLMNIDFFPQTMIVAYLGLLHESDFADMKRFWQRIRSKITTICYVWMRI